MENFEGMEESVPTICPTQYIINTIALAILFFVLPATFVASNPSRTIKPVGYPANNHTPT